jgi:hypothetical protein
MKSYILSSLMLSAAAVFAGIDDVQAQTPTSSVVNNTQNSGAKRIFVKDPEFELKMLDYQVRAVVQSMIDNPRSVGVGTLTALSRRQDDPRKAQYIYRMISQLIVHKDPGVRASGALWADFALTANAVHNLKKEEAEIVKRLIKRAADDSNEIARGNSVMALGRIGSVLPDHRKACFDALIKSAEDSDEYVRSAGVLSLLELAEEKDYGAVREILQKLSNEDDVNTVRNAEYQLKLLDEKEAKLKAPQNTPNLQP